MRRRTVFATAALSIAAALTITACSSDSPVNGMGRGMGSGGHGHAHGSQTQNAPSKAGQFRLYEWGIRADSKQLPSGRQTITALNAGNHTHELVIVKAADAAGLPTKSDGSVDEKALENATVGEIADVAAGSSKHATFDFPPGSYVAFCNITDDMGMGSHMERNHFELGMHTTFTVTAS